MALKLVGLGCKGYWEVAGTSSTARSSAVDRRMILTAVLAGHGVRRSFLRMLTASTFRLLKTPAALGSTTSG